MFEYVKRFGPVKRKKIGDELGNRVLTRLRKNVGLWRCIYSKTDDGDTNNTKYYLSDRGRCALQEWKEEYPERAKSLEALFDFSYHAEPYSAHNV